MFYPDRLSSKQHVFESLKNIRKEVATFENFKQRDALLRSLDNVISWESQVISSPIAKLVQFWFDLKVLFISKAHNVLS